MRVTIYQLGYRNSKFPKGVPVLDCRSIKNPYPKQGEEARELVRKDIMFNNLVKRAMIILSYSDSITIACSYGKHRSGAVVEEVTKQLKELVEDIKIDLRKEFKQNAF